MNTELKPYQRAAIEKIKMFGRRIRILKNAGTPSDVEPFSEQVKRAQAISTIDILYSADSEFSSAQTVGKKLLEGARYDVPSYNWRNESTEVLLRYAELCKAHHANETMNAIKRKA